MDKPLQHDVPETQATRASDRTTDARAARSRREPPAATRGLGETVVGRCTAWTMIAGFAALVFLVPIVDQGLGALHRRQKGGWPVPPVADVATLLPRSETVETAMAGAPAWRGIRTLNQQFLRARDRFTTGLESASSVAAWLTPPLRRVLSGTLHGGNESVYIGWSGWLFYRPDVEYLTRPGFLQQPVLDRQTSDHLQGDPLPAIMQFRDALAQRGIALLLAPTPVKPMIYPEQFALRYGADDVLNNPDYGAFIARLDAAGIAVCDLLAPLVAAKHANPDHGLYLATDTHWTPAGVAIAARTLADTLSTREGLELNRNADAKAARPQQNVGDLARMLEHPGRVRLHAPESVLLPAAAQIRESAAAQVLLLGDSFSNIYSLPDMGWGEGAGLAEQLSTLLNAPVDAVCVNGDGAYASRRALSLDLLRGQDRLAGKRVVIWQFALRELTQGDWRTDIPMAPRPPVHRSGILPAPEAVEGRIVAMTTPPSPGSIPYETAIIALRLAPAPGGTAGAAPDRLVYLWGMRGDQWTDAMRWRPGDTISLTLLPWSSVEPFVGRNWRVELDDPDATALEAYWAVTQPGMAALLDGFAGVPAHVAP